MRKKDGFVATSVIYSFFLVFVTLFIGLISNYFQNQLLLKTLNDASKETLFKINNIKVTDLKVGDHLNFKMSADQTLISNDASWVISYIDKQSDYTNYYVLSDLNAQNLDVRYKLSTDAIVKMHTVTIDVFNELVNLGAYKNAILYPNVTISLPTMNIMKKIRAQNLDPAITNEIYGVSGNYVIYADSTSNGYESGKYYEYRLYRFNETNQSILPKYCNANYDGVTGKYNVGNLFGYMNIAHNSSLNTKFVNYCFYANPDSYNHPASDHVVFYDDDKENGDLITVTNTSIYTLRLMATINIKNGEQNCYVAGGKGTEIDPYILTDGVKIS